MRATETDALMKSGAGDIAKRTQKRRYYRAATTRAVASAKVFESTPTSTKRKEEEENERVVTGAGVPRLSVCFGANDRRFRETDWRRYGAVHLLACAMANIVTLGVYGVLQQRIMTIPYSSDDGKEG